MGYKIVWNKQNKDIKFIYPYSQLGEQNPTKANNSKELKVLVLADEREFERVGYSVADQVRSPQHSSKLEPEGMIDEMMKWWQDDMFGTRVWHIPC